MDEISFTQACSRFFGKKDGQSLNEFGAEIKMLSPKDREDMIPGLEKNLDVKIKRD